jgi:GNAT superfamily N-acetyltransferase
VSTAGQTGFVIELLGPQHDRAAFSCGVEALDAYLHRQASQDLRKRAAVPLVITPDHRIIAGFYTLSQYAIDLGAVPPDVARKLPRYPLVPATLLGRLAVGLAFRGRGLGETLLMDALHRSLQSSKQVASAAVLVEAKDEAAEGFYRKHRFVSLTTPERRLFLPMATIALLFG